MKIFLFYFMLTSYIVTGCIEPYYFDIESSSDPLVIESYISDVSFNKSLLYPSDGKYFITKLKYGQNLFNKGQNVTGAKVEVLSGNGNSWMYTEVSPGEYWLLDKDFHAVIETKYKTKITLSNNEIYESEWEMLHVDHQKMGDISFIETEMYKIQFKNGGGDKSLGKVNGIELTVEIPVNLSSKKKYYKWQYEQTWIYLAGRLSNDNPFYKCWVRGNSILSPYTIAEDNVGGYNKSLVFINVDTNERTFKDLSVLVKQFIISKDYYNFLKELEEQGHANNIFTGPPYNLKTNYYSLNNNKPVFGYFSVRHEEAKRFYFSVADLSYYVDSNIGIANCRSAIGPYPPDDPCDNCLNYIYGGEPTIIKPYWWH